ncbi:MAG: hypothetical protein IKQ04_07825 [Oscillospiraceae bacterium]|nr:hypothetical protein [Oscillospiraceae bacterium]
MPTPETMKEYFDRLNKMRNKTPAQIAFLEAVKAVNTASAKLRKPDRFKRIPYVLAQDRDKLMELHRAVGKAAEAILKDQNESQAVRELVEKFANLASANYTRLGGYEPDKKPKTLDAIEEETRTMYLDHSSEELAGKKGNALSTRIPVSFLDSKNRKVEGFFTPKYQVNLFDTLGKRFRELADQQNFDGLPDENGQLFLNNLLSRMEEKLPGMIQNKKFDPANYADTRSQVLGYLYEHTLEKEKEESIDASRLSKVIKDFFPEETRNMSEEDISNALGAEVLTSIAEAMNPYVNHVTITMQSAGIPDGGRVDSRNAAMSAVADLLHMPNVIARARPMVLRDQNGNEIEGTFMALAEGEDTSNHTAAASGVNGSAFEGTDGKALKDVADLQVLDFICGNVDRHYGNMLYKLDKNKKLVGVTGIDNDCGLGVYVPKGGESHKYMAGLMNMRAVSESTYERVMALDGDTLRYALRGFGLSKEELDAAAKRLDMLQKALSADVEYFKENVGDAIIEEVAEGNQAEAQTNRVDKDGKPLPRIGVENGPMPLTLSDEHIRVVPDDSFDRLEIDELLVVQDMRTGLPAGSRVAGNAKLSGNTFRGAYIGVAFMGERYSEQRRPHQVFSAKILEDKSRSNWAELPRYLEQAEDFSTRLESNTRTFHSNGKYRDMESAAKEYIKVMRKIRERTRIANQEELKSRPNYKMDLQAVVTPKDLKDMQKAAEKLNKAAERYLKYKLGPNMDRSLNDLTEYSKGRVHCAQDLLNATEKLKVLRGDELNEAQTNEREAKEGLARRLGDKAEERAYANRPKPAPQPILN